MINKLKIFVKAFWTIAALNILGSFVKYYCKYIFMFAFETGEDADFYKLGRTKHRIERMRLSLRKSGL